MAEYGMIGLSNEPPKEKRKSLKIFGIFKTYKFFKVIYNEEFTHRKR